MYLKSGLSWWSSSQHSCIHLTTNSPHFRDDVSGRNTSSIGPGSIFTFSIISGTGKGRGKGIRPLASRDQDNWEYLIRTVSFSYVVLVPMFIIIVVIIWLVGGFFLGGGPSQARMTGANPSRLCEQKKLESLPPTRKVSLG